MSYLDFDFPHTRFFESDLRELIKQVFIMNDLVTNFVSINAIKYANPIQWDITKSYEKNTVVIDGNSGVAYISVRPVPAGIALTREQYWTKVFDLSIFITKGAANFANTYEAEPTTTATQTTQEGNWVVWDTTLYQALNTIHPGDRYVPGGNIRKMTVEDFYNILKSIIDNEVHEREAGDDALEIALNEETELRAEGDSALHTEIVNESVARENADSALQDNIDAEAQARANADDSIITRIDNEILDRQNADNAINTRIDELVAGEAYVNVKSFGAVGDAKYYNKSTRTYWKNANYTGEPTDDTQAVSAAIAYAVANNINIIYFPAGYYYLPNWTYNIDITKIRFVGEGETALVSSGLTSGDFITISSPLALDMYNTAKCPLENISLWGCYGIGTGSTVNGLHIDIPENVVACHCSFKDVVVKDFNHGLDSNQGYKTVWYNFSAIACQIGIYLYSNSAIPQYFIGGFVECCGIGLWFDGPDWSNAVFYAYAFEYNLQQIAVTNGVVFDSCRFENDPLCTKQSYNFTINGQHVFFNNCDIMLLTNFEMNVGNWIPNPAQYKTASSITYGLFAGTGDLHLLNSRIGLATVTIGSGFYLIGTAKVYAINSEFNGNADAMSKLVDTTKYQAISNTLI